MADERASITITLIDEASEPLQNIANQFESIRRGMEQFSGRGQEQFRRTREEIGRVSESTLARTRSSDG